MTQMEIWQRKYDEVIAFIEKNKRNPSKYDPEERGLYLNWLRHNRKLYNSGELKSERVESFEQLLELTGRYRRKNQYQ
ncbi:MAG: helicase associated domain-containing protein [Bacteroidaceae bacterium]|nr:helicase associated domain-containing protein [Bacteroidaceae bacterium]